MDTTDRSESPNLPSPFRPLPSSLPALPTGFSGDLATSGAQVDSKTLLRGLTRHWWQILVVWSVVSTPVVSLIYHFVKPTYEAFSTLRVTPGGISILPGSSAYSEKNIGYMQTQVALIFPTECSAQPLRAQRLPT